MSRIAEMSNTFLTGTESPQASSRASEKNLGQIKRARRQIDLDAGILANRIALLKQEELKALRKVQETKRKTQEVYLLKQRNEERLQEKLMHLEVKNENLKASVIASGDLREQKRINRQNIIQEIYECKHKDMMAIRIQRDINNARKWDFKNQVVQQNASKSKLIKEQEALAVLKKQQFIDQKLVMLKLEKDRMYDEEEAEKLKKESLVRELEAMEMNLVKKLQSTQYMQKAAFEELQTALVQPVEMKSTKYSHMRTSSMGLTPLSSSKKTFEIEINSTRGMENKQFNSSRSNMKAMSHRQSTSDKVGDLLSINNAVQEETA